MIRTFVRGIDEKAAIHILPCWSFITIDKTRKVGFAVKTSLVKNAYLCLKLLNEKYGKGWVIPTI